MMNINNTIKAIVLSSIFVSLSVASAEACTTVVAHTSSATVATFNNSVEAALSQTILEEQEIQS